MAGGAESKVGKKRKRKTRSERNFLRHSQMSLRSSKVSAASLPPAPRDVRISRNITQGRLTMGIFPYSKSSDCIKRGPIPETESVKKKVAEDMKRIVNPSASPIAGCSGDGCGSRIITTLSDSDRNTSVASKVVEHIRTRQVSSMSAVPVANESKKTNVQVQTSSPVTTTHHILDTTTTAKACPKSNSSSSYASAKSDSELDEVLPVNEIADKILQNLKPKFKKLFPTKDLNMELNSSLQKLLRQSSRKVSLPKHTPELPISKENAHCLQAQQGTYSALSACQINDTRVSVSPTFQSASIIGADEAATAAQHIICSSNFSNKTNSPQQPQTVLQHFQLSTNNPSGFQGDSSKSKSVQFLLTSDCLGGDAESHGNVRVVVESNRPSNNPHQQRPHFDQHTTSTSSTSTSGHYRCRNQGNNNSRVDSSIGFLLPNAFGDHNAEVQDSDRPLIINIDNKEGEESDNDDDDSRFALAKYNSFMASARSLKAKLEKQSEQKHVMSHERTHHCVPPGIGGGGGCICRHCVSPTATNCYPVNRFKFADDSAAVSSKHPGASALSALGIKKGNSTSSGTHHRHPDYHHHNHNHLRSRTHGRPMAPCYSSEGNNEPDAISGSSNLAKSRHRLKTALDSILMDPNEKLPKSSVVHSNEESMDWQDVDILTDILPRANDSYHHHNHHQEFHRQPLDELRIHQSDMQHQARSFLDHVDQDFTDGPPHMSSSSPHYPLSTSLCTTAAWL